MDAIDQIYFNKEMQRIWEKQKRKKKEKKRMMHNRLAIGIAIAVPIVVFIGLVILNPGLVFG